MAYVEWERSGDRFPRDEVEGAQQVTPTDRWDPYDETVDGSLRFWKRIRPQSRLWRKRGDTRAVLEVTEAELARTLEALAAERRGHREVAS